jgi:hypothetical protein
MTGVSDATARNHGAKSNVKSRRRHERRMGWDITSEHRSSQLAGGFVAFLSRAISGPKAHGEIESPSS